MPQPYRTARSRSGLGDCQIFCRFEFYRLPADLPLQLGNPLLSFERPTLAPKHCRRIGKKGDFPVG